LVDWKRGQEPFSRSRTAEANESTKAPDPFSPSATYEFARPVRSPSTASPSGRPHRRAAPQSPPGGRFRAHRSPTA
jgi:hypothetical protein